MAKVFVLTVLLANLIASNCQIEDAVDSSENETSDAGNPSYSFSYGVSDARTGDIKSVWESKEGDTVKGHYSVLGPDGSMRTVEYSAAPDTGFKAVVNTESAVPQAVGSARTYIQDKAMRDYEKYYDFAEDEEEEPYIERRKKKRPQEYYKEHSRRRPQYPDLEPSEYTHSISIKHPYDESLSEGEPHSHVGYSFDPNCKTKHKKESYDNGDNSYASLAEFESNKHKYPALFSPDSFKDFNKFAELTDFDLEKPTKFSYHNNFKATKFDDENIKPASSMKYNYPALPETSPPERYEKDDYRPSRPKKKHRPQKQDFHSSEDMDEYVLVPKKKYKPKRVVEPNDYRPSIDDDYERPHYNDDDDHDDRYQSPPRGSKPIEVVRKIVQKRRPPVINLLDIFDI